MLLDPLIAASLVLGRVEAAVVGRMMTAAFFWIFENENGGS